MKFEPNRIKIALPKKGRLRAPAIDLFTKAGYIFKSADYLLYSKCQNHPIDFVFIRTEDIPSLVENGIVDLGVTGSDHIEEKRSKLHPLLDLAYGNCRLCLAGKGKKKYKNLSEISGSNIATSFPFVTKDFFNKHKVKVNPLKLSGSIEIMIDLQIADLIVDVVDTGETLKEHNLSVWETIGHYSTILYCKPALKNHPQVIQIKKRLNGILIANFYSVLEYNISKSLVNKAKKITPGYDAPTISFLENQDMVSVKVMIEKKLVANAIDTLEDIGASAIYETQIKKFRP